MSDTTFTIAPPQLDAATGTAHFSYALGDLRFIETLTFPPLVQRERALSHAFERLLNLTACALGTSYFKLLAPLQIEITGFGLSENEQKLVLDMYENGLGEFYARNNLKRFGKLDFSVVTDNAPLPAIDLEARTLLPIGGGKDSLVSVQLLERAGIEFTPFAVNPKGPIVGSIEKIERPALTVKRVLDAEMIRLGQEPGYLNGHVPMTAINSLIAAMTAVLFSYDAIALSNERSASEGNIEFDGREANHQHSKSIDFERMLADVLHKATGGALSYFSLLRPLSEVKIGKLFANETRFDQVFSSCNRNFRQAGHEGALWCGNCPKCHFTFLMLAPHMPKQRLLDIFGQNLLNTPANEAPYRELCGLAGQKPWECVGEILEAAACLWVLSEMADWHDDAIVAALRADLERQYGAAQLNSAMQQFLTDSSDHLVPAPVMAKVFPNAH